MINKTGLHNDIDYVLLDQETLQRRVHELAEKLTNDYRGKNPVFLCILKGSVHFFNARKTSGIVRINKDLDMSITGRHVIIVEDIMDSGLTLNHLTSMLRAREPASLKIVALLDKPERRECAITPDYYGFVVPNEFVVGYGLDYAGTYRNLPFVGVLKDEVHAD